MGPGDWNVLVVDPPGVRGGAGEIHQHVGCSTDALAHELDLLGVELAKSADSVVATDRAGLR